MGDGEMPPSQVQDASVGPVDIKILHLKNMHQSSNFVCVAESGGKATAKNASIIIAGLIKFIKFE